MERFQPILTQLKQMWSQANPVGRIVFCVAVAMSLALVAGVGFWSSRPQYVVLAANLDPSRAAEIVDGLEAEGIPHRLNFSGSSISVPKHKLNQSRMAVGQLVTPAHSADEASDSALIPDPQWHAYRLLQLREQELARSIMKMPAIASAEVHLGVPKPSPFVRDRQPTTASVVVDLARGHALTKEQAASIVAIVSGAVQGLARESITVTDTSGKILWSSGGQQGDEMISAYEYRRNLEADLTAKADIMLSRILGPGRAAISVAADIDFTRRTYKEEMPDPESRVANKVVITSTKTNESRPTVGGPAGVASNISGQPGTTSSTANSTTQEDNTSEYMVGIIVEERSETTPVLRRLSVAVTADLMNEEGQPIVTSEQVGKLVRQAVGFDEQRGDQIEVVVAKLVNDDVRPADDLLQLQKWNIYEQIVRNASLALAALTSLVLMFILLKRVKPITITQRADDDQQREELIARLSSAAKSDPDALAHVLSVWLSDDPGKVSGAIRRPSDDSSGPEQQSAERRAA
jgi:flagellar M-ring protein FliF